MTKMVSLIGAHIPSPRQHTQWSSLLDLTCGLELGSPYAEDSSQAVSLAEIQHLSPLTAFSLLCPALFGI